ncbi:hypothetical protein ACJX0J_030445, partial [Zea mays]
MAHGEGQISGSCRFVSRACAFFRRPFAFHVRMYMFTLADILTNRVAALVLFRFSFGVSAASHKEFKIACLTVDDSSLGPGDEYFGLYTPKLLAVTEDDYESDPRMPGEDEFDHFYRVLAKKTDNLLSCYIPMPLALSEEEKAVQKEFKLIASGCIDLLVGAMRRTPAEKRRPLFLVFGELYPVFEFVRWTAEAGCAKWWMALQIIEKLEIVRKMVSSAFGGAPVDRSMVFARKVDLTGVDGEALAGHGLGSNLSVVIFVLMDSVFSNVKSDIDAMVSDPCRMADEDVQEFDHYYRHLAKRAAKLHAIYPPELPKPLSESEDEKAVQERFKEMANESIDLAAGAMRRIPAEKWRPLISVFAYVFLVFISDISLSFLLGNTEKPHTGNNGFWSYVVPVLGGFEPKEQHPLGELPKDGLSCYTKFWSCVVPVLGGFEPKEQHPLGELPKDGLSSWSGIDL